MTTNQPPYAIYSATRQWNPGDEFILAGARRVVETALGPFEPLLYDRNPDVRPGNGATVALRNSRRPLGEEEGAVYEKLSAYLRLGFSSNSVKFDSDLSYASLAVMAGSPEWSTPRCWSFYDHVLRNNLPLVGLGLGSMPDHLPEFIHSALDKAVLLTTRSRSLAQSDLARRYGIDYLPCPAFLSAPAARQVDEVRRVAVAIGVPYQDAVWANGLESSFYDAVCRALDSLFARHSAEIEFDFVIHYIDEIPVIRDRFPQHRTRYSFDSSDYVDIYNEYDLVISTRVHACGIAASSGIPSISMGHDFRSDTTDGFLSVSVDARSSDDALNAPFEDLVARASEVSSELARHRQATLDEYVERLRSGFDAAPERIDYDPSAAVVWDAEVEGSDGTDLETLVRTLVDDAGRDAREMRRVLTEVETSKAEMAVELDGARSAVIRLSGELERLRRTPVNRIADKIRRR